jgi:hypothetical protein
MTDNDVNRNVTPNSLISKNSIGAQAKIAQQQMPTINESKSQKDTRTLGRPWEKTPQKWGFTIFCRIVFAFGTIVR